MSDALKPNDSNRVEDFLTQEVGLTPSTSVGWFRAAVAFYNKNELNYALQCLLKGRELDENNFNIHQLAARVYVKLGSKSFLRDDPITLYSPT
jgi:predicted Zn-dependent protease